MKNAMSKLWLVLPFTFALASQASAQQAGLVQRGPEECQGPFDIANHLNVNISNVPITVQAPISVAAAVCQVTVAVLSTAINKGGASCYAQSTSSALNKIVQNVMNVQLQSPRSYFWAAEQKRGLRVGGKARAPAQPPIRIALATFQPGSYRVKCSACSGI